MLTVSAFAEELIILKQCQWLKKFNLNLILTSMYMYVPLKVRRSDFERHIGKCERRSVLFMSAIFDQT